MKLSNMKLTREKIASIKQELMEFHNSGTHILFDGMSTLDMSKELSISLIGYMAHELYHARGHAEMMRILAQLAKSNKPTEH